MTGTILVNNPQDLYCPMAFIGLIQPNKWIYENKYLINAIFISILNHYIFNFYKFNIQL